ALERRVQETCLRAIQAGLIESAHDCSDGGLAVALAESCFSSYRRDAVGCNVKLAGELSAAALMFSESPSRFVVSSLDSNVEAIRSIADEQGVTASVIGRTGGDRFVITVNGEGVIDRPVSEIEEKWRSELPGKMEVPSIIAAEESLIS